jgi:hypothetical protein
MTAIDLSIKVKYRAEVLPKQELVVNCHAGVASPGGSSSAMSWPTGGKMPSA